MTREYWDETAGIFMKFTAENAGRETFLRFARAAMSTIGLLFRVAVHNSKFAKIQFERCHRKHEGSEVT